MIRIARLGILHLLLALGLILAAGPISTGEAGAPGLRAHATVASVYAVSNRAAATDPDDNKLSPWMDGDDDVLPLRMSPIAWLRPEPTFQPLPYVADPPATHPVCAFPPRAPPCA